MNAQIINVVKEKKTIPEGYFLQFNKQQPPSIKIKNIALRFSKTYRSVWKRKKKGEKREKRDEEPIDERRRVNLIIKAWGSLTVG